jgi:protein-tyrosine phosphatase
VTAAPTTDTLPTETLTTETPRRRLLDVAGTYNLRDTGGYAARGGVTRWGRLLRSDALHQVDDAGRAVLADLGLGVVIDLRGEDERAAQPSALDGLGHRTVLLPIESGSSASLVEAFDLAAIYAEFVESHGPLLTAAVRAIAAAGDTPTLVHCAAGKDRTGLTVALALTAVGVDREDVLTDYEVSGQHLAGEWLDSLAARIAESGVTVPPAVLTALGASPADLLRSTFADLDRLHGGPVGYLRDHGMTDVELDALHSALVEPA